MDWDNANNITEKPLQYYERAAIRMRKKSTAHTSFIRCAFQRYKASSMAARRQTIRQVFSRALSPSNVSVVKLVRRCWATMPQAIKIQWGQRSEYLNEQPHVGILHQVPRTVPRNRDSFIKSCAQEECDNLQNQMRAFIIKKRKGADNNPKAVKYSFPQPLTAEGKIMKQDLSLSPMLRQIIFGDNFCKILSHENATNNNRYAPGYFHFSSYCRLNSVFSLEDISFCTHVDEQTKYSYNLTSMGCIQNAAGNTYKCWGWSETTNKITFIYNDEGDDLVPAKFVEFDRPKFVTTQEMKVGSNGIERFVTRRRYDDLDKICSDETSGFYLIQYTPVCIKIHLKKCNLLHMIGARLVVRRDPANNNYTYIVSGPNLS